MEKLYSNIKSNLQRIRGEIAEAEAKHGRAPGSVRLMAVTKTVAAEAVNEAIGLGVNLLGENKAQELLAKHGDYLPAEIHFIGHLQSNKISKIIDKVSLIQSVDRMGLAEEISSQAQKIGRTMQVLIEVNIGGEISKSGSDPDEALELILKIAELPAVEIKGLMTIPPICSDILSAERFFCRMQQLYVDITAKKLDNVDMEILSMGMSDDFPLAIKYGSNLVRIGTALFGKRDAVH